jgi:hypothetical protein
MGGEHYNAKFNGQTISINFEISKFKKGHRYRCPCESLLNGY